MDDIGEPTSRLRPFSVTPKAFQTSYSISPFASAFLLYSSSTDSGGKSGKGGSGRSGGGATSSKGGEGAGAGDMELAGALHRKELQRGSRLRARKD